jgi:hypothetical protein
MSQDSIAVHAQKVERLASNENCQGGIQAPGNADRYLWFANMFESCREARNLGLKYLLATLVELFLPARHKGMCVHFAQEHSRRLGVSLQGEIDREPWAPVGLLPSVFAKAIEAKSVDAKVVEIDVGGQQNLLTLEAR